VVVWISDTVIVKKPTSNKALYFVADAASGQPIAKANLEFFGFKQRHVKDNDYHVDTKQYAEFTNAEGLVYQSAANELQNYQWLVTATTDQGRFAHLGFTGVWNASYYEAEYNETKLFMITDRPVYRPGQKVSYKFWIGQAQYDAEGTS